mmetsp:Transcript_19835/g.66716  ORF Transcript_19835/g.66716 Transcript_19835/m.66716 type:complete len:142 (-) Transcript_19835:468-893(-)
MREDKVASAFGTSFDPGQGGWPTHRFFNKETGYGGRPYARRTDKKVCEELGDAEAMRHYVEEASGVRRCDPASGSGCSEREAAYAAKLRAHPGATASELQRVARTLDAGEEDVPLSLQIWAHQRLHILQRLADGGALKEEL